MSLTLQKVKENLVLDLVNLTFFQGPLFNQENKIHNKLKLLYLGWTYIILEYSHVCWEPQESTNGRVISLSKRMAAQGIIFGVYLFGAFWNKNKFQFQSKNTCIFQLFCFCVQIGWNGNPSKAPKWAVTGTIPWNWHSFHEIREPKDLMAWRFWKK